MKKFKNVLWVVGIAFVLDQITKWIILKKIVTSIPFVVSATDLIPTPVYIAKVTSFFNIIFAWNKGVSFSILSGDKMQWILVLISLAIVSLLIHWLKSEKNEIRKIGFGLIIGGALGNVIDRIRFGAVVDFLDVHAYGYHWPTFNVADMCIVLGAGLYLWTQVQAEKIKNKKK